MPRDAAEADRPCSDGPRLLGELPYTLPFKYQSCFDRATRFFPNWKQLTVPLDDRTGHEFRTALRIACLAAPTLPPEYDWYDGLDQASWPESYSARLGA